jgi:hypothetical protein
VNRPDQIMIDRFPVANAEFWLTMTARWLAEPSHADQFAADLWPGFSFAGPPVQVIVAEAAIRLRAWLNNNDDTDGGDETGWT